MSENAAGRVSLRDLRYLVAVDDHRHFGRAAASCFVSQPTLSTQLRKLEDALGVQLVERSHRRVMLTPVGRRVADRARAVLNEVADIVDLARAAADPLGGELRLGVIPTVGPYLLPHLMPVLRTELPRLRVLLYEQQTAPSVVRLERGELDAAIMAAPVNGHGLDSMPLFVEPFHLAVPAGHPLSRQQRITMDDLETSQLLLLEEGHCLRDQALELCARAGAREDAEFRATSLETLRQMVASGAGITLLPALAAAAGAGIPNQSAVAVRPFAEPAPHREIAIYWRRGAAREDTVRALGEVISQLDVVRDLLPGVGAESQPA